MTEEDLALSNEDYEKLRNNLKDAFGKFGMLVEADMIAKGFIVNPPTPDEEFHHKLRQNGITEIVKKGYYKNGTERAKVNP